MRRLRARRRWSSLRRQGLILVHVLHPGKTGGTALKDLLARARGEASGYRIVLHPHAVTLRDVPVGDKVVFFVRDPVARFVSGFWSRHRQGQPRYHVAWSEAEARAFAEFPTPDALGAALSAPDAGVRSRAEAAMRSIGHVRDSYWSWFGDEAYFRSRLPDILMVGRTETMEASCEALRRLLSLPDSAGLPSDEVAAHRRQGGDEPLGAEALANLRRWYEADYAFLELCAAVGLIESAT